MRFINLMLNKYSRSYRDSSTAYKTKYLGELDNMVTDESAGSMKVNRLALVLLTVIATVVGFAPAVLILGRPQLLLYFAVGAALVVGLSLRNFKSYATELPTIPEFLLGGLAAVLTPSTLGGFWLIAYGLIYGATKLVGSVAVWVGMQLHLNADFIAFYPTVVLATLIGAGLVIVEGENMASRLYPNTAGIKSAFYTLLTQGRRGLTISTVVALVILGAAFLFFVRTDAINPWFYLFLELYLLVVSGAAMLSSGETTRPREAADAVEDISQLFEVAGYQVERSPRTGSAAIDPLLLNLDVLAQKSGHNIFVNVKTASESTKPIDWRAGTGLTTATRALSKRLDLSAEDVDRLLVLVDMKPDKSLRTFGKKEKVKILSITSDDVKRILEEEINAEERQEAARKLLGVPADPNDVTPSSVSAGPGSRS